MRVSENMVLRKIFRAKTDEVAGDGRRLRNGQLNDLYSSPNIIWVMKSRTMRWAGHVGRMRDRRCAYRMLVGKPDGKTQFGRPIPKCEDNIKIDRQEVGRGDWIALAQDRDRRWLFVSTAMNLRVP